MNCVAFWTLFRVKILSPSILKSLCTYELMYRRNVVTKPHMENPTNNPRFPPTAPNSLTNGMIMISSLWVVTSGDLKSYATTYVGTIESLSLATAPASS